MISELEELRENQFYALAAERVKTADAGESKKGRTLQEVMTEKEWAEFEAIDSESIADEDLFE